MRSFPAVVLILLVAAAASAQVQSRPTDAPIVTAEREPWYIQGDPVQFAGNVYIRAGAALFFDGNRMVRTGNFNGVPLYADTTAEPYSLVYVPIGRGLMQPYERPRTGDLAGTVGSRAPSFPVGALPSSWTLPMAAGAPTNIGTLILDEPPAAPPAAAATPRPAPVSAPPSAPAAASEPVRPGRPATPAEIQAARNQVWVEFRGQKWIPAGSAIPLAGSNLVKAGEFSGFPVYVTETNSPPTRIFLPAMGGLVTPYEVKP